MITEIAISRSAVKFGEMWSCCVDTAEYAGAFDTANGDVAWHGLCSSCAHSYVRTVCNGVIARIV